MMFNITRKDKCSRLVFDVGVGECTICDLNFFKIKWLTNNES